MGSLADKLNYLLATKDAIRDAIVGRGVTVEDDATFRSYAEKIGAINSYSFPYSYSGRYKADAPTTVSLAPALRVYSTVTADNITYALENPVNYSLHDSLYFFFSDYPGVQNATRFVAPRHMTVYSRGGAVMTALYDNFLCDGLTLPCEGSLIAKWITVSAIFSGQMNEVVVTPGGITKIPNIYLDVLNLAVGTERTGLLALLNNLADVSSEEGKTYCLSIGSHNLAKLTQEQMDIAYNKGWELT